MSLATVDLSQIPMSQNLAASLARASEVAAGFGASEVSLEHVLLALCDDSDAQAVLVASQVDIVRVRAETNGFLRSLKAEQPQANLGVSPYVTRILEAAAAAARGGRRRDINGAIVLAAIVGDGKSAAAQILQAQGLTFDEAIRALQSALTALPRDNGADFRPADDVLAGARARVQSRSAPTLRDIMSDIPRPPVPPPVSGLPPAVPPPVFEPIAQPAPEIAPSAPQPPLPLAPPAQELQTAEVSAPVVTAPTPLSSEVPVPAPVSVTGTGGASVSVTDPATASINVPSAVPDASGAAASEAGARDTRYVYPSVEPQAHPAVPVAVEVPSGYQADGMFRADVLRELAQGPPVAAHTARPNGLELQRPAPIATPPPIPLQVPQPGGNFAGRPAYAPYQSPSPHAPRLDGPRLEGPAPFNPSLGPQRSASQGQPNAGIPASEMSQVQVNRPPAPPRTRAPGLQSTGPQGGGPTAQQQRNAKPKTELGQLAENIPRSMRVGETQRVEVRISKASAKAITEGMDGGGVAWRHDVTITQAMSVRLRAPDGGFFIETASPETQWVESQLGFASDEFASWRFLVTPQNRGRSRLQILVSARTIGADGLAAETAMPDQVIEVKVRSNYKRGILRLGGWIIAAVAGGALAKFGEGGLTAAQAFVEQFMR